MSIEHADLEEPHDNEHHTNSEKEEEQRNGPTTYARPFLLLAVLLQP
jgi:hypothetical protein